MFEIPSEIQSGTCTSALLEENSGSSCGARTAQQQLTCEAKQNGELQANTMQVVTGYAIECLGEKAWTDRYMLQPALCAQHTVETQSKHSRPSKHSR